MKRLLSPLSFSLAVATICTVFSLVSQPLAQAGLIVHESFAVGTESGEYANNTSITGQGHGTGFGSNTWSTSTNNADGIWKTQSGGLTSPYLANAQDGFLEFTRTSTGSFSGTATRTVSVGSLSETSYYMSALFRVNQWGGHDVRVDIDFGGTNPMSFGITSAGNPGMGGNGLQQVDTEIELTAGQTYLFVVKITDGGSNDDQWLWIDPATSTEPNVSTAAMYRGTGNRINATDNQPRSVVLNLTRHPDFVYSFDEIQISTTWEGLGIIPEPSTYGMILGIICLAGVMVRRRFIPSNKH